MPRKKAIILSGRHEGVEGYILHEYHHAVTIEACGWFGDVGWYGRYYARKDNIRITEE